jgi:hypothetical protein
VKIFPSFFLPTFTALEDKPGKSDISSVRTLRMRSLQDLASLRFNRLRQPSGPQASKPLLPKGLTKPIAERLILVSRGAGGGPIHKRFLGSVDREPCPRMLGPPEIWTLIILVPVQEMYLRYGVIYAQKRIPSILALSARRVWFQQFPRLDPPWVGPGGHPRMRVAAPFSITV